MNPQRTQFIVLLTVFAVVALLIVLLYIIGFRSVTTISDGNEFSPTTTPSALSGISSTTPMDAIIVPAEDLDVLPQQPRHHRGPCIVTGCSGEICASEDVVSVCIYQEEFSCYRTAICEKQADGNCGWTGTVELNQCLANYSSAITPNSR